MLFAFHKNRNGKRKRQHQHRPYSEQFSAKLNLRKLEPRRVLSVSSSLSLGILQIDFDAADDQVEVSQTGTNIVVDDGTTANSFAASSIQRIDVSDAGGIDTISFQDTVSLSGSAGFSLLIDSIESVNFFGNYSLSDSIFVSGGKVDDGVSGVLAVAGATSINAGAHSITLDNNHDFSSLSLTSTAAVVVKDVNGVTLSQVSADDFTLNTGGSITDSANATIMVLGNADLFASGDIVLSNFAGDRLDVQQRASFRSANGDVAIGLGSSVLPKFGSLAANGDIVRINESDSTLIVDSGIQANLFSLQSGGSISQNAGSAVTATQAEFTVDVPISSNADFNLLSNNNVDNASFRAVSPGTIGEVHFKNISATADNIQLSSPLAFDALTLWFPNSSIEISDDPMVIGHELTLIAGLDGTTLDNLTTIADATATITHQPGINVFAQSAVLRSAGPIILANNSADQFVIASGLEMESRLGSIDIGVVPVSNPLDPFRGMDSGADFQTGSLTVTSLGHSAIAEDDASILAGNNRFNSLVLFSQGTITDNANASLLVDGPDTVRNLQLTAGTTSNPQDIILGDQGSSIQLNHDPTNPNQFLAMKANNASLQFDSGLNLRNDPQLNIPFDIENTFYLKADGDIVQVDNETTLSVDHGKIKASAVAVVGGTLLIPKASFDTLAFTLTESIDITALANKLPADLPRLSNTGPANANLIDPKSGNRLNPLDSSILSNGPTSSLPPLIVGNQYAALVLNDTQLSVSVVADHTGTQPTLSSATASDGHVYLQTLVGDLSFSTTTNHPVVDIQNKHVFTAVAAGDVRIDPSTNGILRSSTGSVSDVSQFLAFDERFDSPVFTGEGVFIEVTPPSTTPPILTTRVIQPDRIQNINLDIGRDGESNLTLAVVWADGFDPNSTVPNNVTELDVTKVSQGHANVTATHKFELIFLNQNPFATNFPTSIYAFNDPLINLFADGGARNLNQTSVVFGNPNPELDPSLPGTNPQLSANFVLARTQDTVRISEPLPPPDRPQLDSPRVSSELPDAKVQLEERSSFGDSESINVKAVLVVKFGLVNSEGNWIGDPEVWENGPQGDYIETIKKEIKNGDRYPPGRYEIWTIFRNGVVEKVTHLKEFETLDDQSRVEPVAVPDLSNCNDDGDFAGSKAWMQAWHDWSEKEKSESSEHESETIHFDNDNTPNAKAG